MRFRTETGSMYEFDEANKRIRRVSGEHAPTTRQGQDGSWREYHEIWNGLSWVGDRVLIVWNEEGQCTLTSVVEQVWYDVVGSDS